MTRRAHGAQSVAAGLLGTLVIAALGGCAPFPSTVPVDDPRDVRLDTDVIAVVGFSPQLHDRRIVGNSTHGFLLLIGADGRSRTLRTSFMHGLTPAWGTDRVTARDQEHEFEIGPDGTTVTEREGTNAIQLATVTGADGTGSVSLYDLGALSEGQPNTQEVDVDEASGGRTTERFIGSTMGLYPCGDTVYGVDSAPATREGFLRPVARNDPSATFLFRVLPRPRVGASDVVSQLTSAQDSVTLEDSGAACRGHSLLFLGTDGPGWREITERASIGLDVPSDEARSPILRSWDTRTGAVHDLPLISESGLPLPTERLSLGATSLLGDELFWYAPTGIVYATNVGTGRTRDAFHTTPEPVNVRADGHIDDDAVVSFAPGRLFRVSMPRGGDTTGTAGTVTGWNLATGAETLRVSVPAIAAIADEPGHFQRPWGVAVNPAVLRSGLLTNRSDR